MLNTSNINAYMDDLILNGASEETVRAYRSDLNGARRSTMPCIDWPSTEVALARYLNLYRAQLAPRTTQRRLTSFRGWARFLGEPGFLANYKPPVAAAPQPHPIPEGIDGVKRMILSSRNPRHRALCALQGLMGLRVDEAVGIVPADFDLENMMLRVRGKGDKVRYVPIGALAWKYLERSYRCAIVDGTTITRLTNRGARAAITRHGRNAGLSRHVASHDMRATAATAFYERTRDLRAVQEALGHADAKTTQSYTRVSEQAMRAAMDVA